MRVRVEPLVPVVAAVLRVRPLASRPCIAGLGSGAVQHCLGGGSIRLRLSWISGATALFPCPRATQASGRNPDDSARYCHIPASLEQQLMPFQREGVQFALRHGGRALIGDEMGLVRRLPGRLRLDAGRLLAGWSRAAGACWLGTHARRACCCRARQPQTPALSPPQGKTVQAIAVAAAYRVG